MSHNTLSRAEKERLSLGIRQVIKTVEVASNRSPLLATLTLLYSAATLAAALPMPREKVHELVDAAIDHCYPMVAEKMRQKQGGTLH